MNLPRLLKTSISERAKNERMMLIEMAVDKAARDCINEGIIKDVLSEERSAVMLEMLTTFDEKLYAEGLREEGHSAGFSEGHSAGLNDLNALNECLLRDGRIEDLKRSVTDSEFQKKLFHEYFPDRY